MTREIATTRMWRLYSRPVAKFAIGPRAARASQRHISSNGLTSKEIEELLSKPSWSVSSLLKSSSSTEPAERISQKQLHHLLRLSALPLPESPEQERKMIDTLQSQLQFVRAIQSVDTTGVEPLQAIRDESEEARNANEFTLENMKDEFEKEEVVGFARRLRRKAGTETPPTQDLIDPLKLAPNKIGRFVVVNTRKS